MQILTHRRNIGRFLLGTLLLGCLAVQTYAQSGTTRIRGVIRTVAQTQFTLVERSGEVLDVQLPANVTVSEVYPIRLEDIQTGSFIGVAAMPQTDGSQRAIAVTVFPESARGLGEGHRPFDLLPQSTMTNATVAAVVAASSGRTLQLQYKDGSKTVVVPENAPVVTFRPGDKDLLVPGASVSVSVQLLDDKPTATRISAGRNGFVLPY